MKKRIFALAVICLVLLVTGCQPSGETNTDDPFGKGGEVVPKVDDFVLKAKVISVNDRNIEVEVIESDYAFGVYWVLTNESTVYFDKDGSSINRVDIKPDSTVEITYGGQVMMSYPPQIVAHIIKTV